MIHNRKLIRIIGAMALATVATGSAYAQMGGGGMMGGFGAGGGMMGGFGSGGGNGTGMMGGSGTGSRNDNGYGPATNGTRRDAPVAPNLGNRSENSTDLDLGPLNQLDLSTQQLGAINIIDEELRDRRSNVNRRLAAEQEKLRELYDTPERDQSKIDKQFSRIAQLRREMFESSVDAHDRIEALLSTQQRQQLHRVAPRWNAGG